MKTNEVEKRLGISKQSILFYEKEGLVHPKRDESNYRDYDEQDVQILQMIKLLRGMDISIDDIRLVLSGDKSFSECLEMKEQNIEYLMSELEETKNVVSSLKEKNIPLIPALADFELQTKTINFGYNKTNKTPSLGRLLTSKLALSRLMGLIIYSLIFLFFIIVILLAFNYTINSIPVIIGIWIIIFIIVVLLFGNVQWVLLELTNDQYIEFLESSIRYYKRRNNLSHFRYILSSIFNNNRKYLKEVNYEDIKKVTIKEVDRYVRMPYTYIGYQIVTYDFTFDFKDESVILRNPITLEDDQYLVKEIIKAKIKTIEDKDHYLD
ncbi:MerR family transcriptional regulator [Breznakia pachnodae]|uniref:DNA-binding transcriptional MerR regulator n=1 Tax=Breznakia pachnodae TaxID=265178 RepID=A0ABU0E896_9FIRM|nr:MerR family transcriptional regulator [Breznakia pachnodae]MDQ0363114.1 DNA-binding transcriptional MerR regulator [Breznakia pachnodae]